MLFPVVFLRASVVLCSQDGKTTLWVHLGETQLGTVRPTILRSATLLQPLFWRKQWGKQQCRFSIGIIQPTQLLAISERGWHCLPHFHCLLCSKKTTPKVMAMSMVSWSDSPCSLTFTRHNPTGAKQMQGQGLLFNSCCYWFGTGIRWTWHPRPVLVNPLCCWSSALQYTILQVTPLTQNRWWRTCQSSLTVEDGNCTKVCLHLLVGPLQGFS